jgi:hypothetical protein
MKACLFLALLLMCVMSAAQSPNGQEEFASVRHQIKTSHSFIPKNGFVPDKDTAMAIAYAVAVPVYGKKDMDEESPFRTELKAGVWTVLGTLHCESCDGGTLIMQIDKTSGKILFMSHSK